METEQATYKRLYDNGDLIGMLKFLESAQYIVYDAEVQQELNLKIMESLCDPEFADYKDSLESLSERLEELKQERTEQMSKSYRILGKGAYGCVIQPALPNRIQGEWVQHPTNVSKLFSNQANANKAMRNSNVISTMLSTDEQRATRQMVWNRSNFPSTTQSECAFNPDSPIHSVRFPYLGIAVKDLPQGYAQAQAIPVSILLEEFLKLMKQVQTIQAKHYVHGDIHIGNVMIDPQNRKMYTD